MESPDILLVDDNDAVGDCLAEVLALAGYSVLRARTGPEGWELFMAHRPDAVLTDNVMAGHAMSDVSGLELAARVKHASPETPVIMLSGLPPAGASAVCDAVLTKPVHIETLLATLAKAGAVPHRDHRP